MFGNLLLAAGDINFTGQTGGCLEASPHVPSGKRHLGTATAQHPPWEAQLRHCPSLFHFQAFKIKTFQPGNRKRVAQTCVLPAVMRREQLQSRIRSQRESAEKPANCQRAHSRVRKDTQKPSSKPQQLLCSSLKANDSPPGTGGESWRSSLHS